MPMTADEALRDYTLSVEGDVFASISEVFTCPACGGSGHRESPNGIDDPRCCQCGGGGMVRVISTHYLEWLREQVAQCDEVCKPDRAIAARAREELGRLKERLTCLVSRYDECTVPTSKGKLAGLIGDLRVEIALLKRIIEEGS